MKLRVLKHTKGNFSNGQLGRMSDAVFYFALHGVVGASKNIPGGIKRFS